MKILLSGGSGLIGTAFSKYVHQHDPHSEIINLSRRDIPSSTEVKQIVDLDLITPKTHFDAIINLNGAGIADSRWTEKRKALLFGSRIDQTKQLIESLNSRGIRCKTWINASAVGYYGDQGDKLVTEKTRANHDFSHQLCSAWEEAANNASVISDRVSIVRLGPVLSPDGGFLEKMRLPFKLGLGTILGSGKQYLPWIHIDDVNAALDHIIKSDHVHGPINLSAPAPVSNDVFSRSFAKSLHRPLLLRTPSIVLKIMLGEMSELLLGGQNAVPEKLLESNFQFKYADIESALGSLN